MAQKYLNISPYVIDHGASIELAGRRVGISSMKGPRRSNDDSLAAIDLDGMDPSKYGFALGTALEETEDALRNSGLPDASGTTYTSTIYDGKNIHALTRGDSPAYLTLWNDAGDAVTLQLTYPADARSQPDGELMLNGLDPIKLNLPLANRPPARQIIYSFDADPKRDPASPDPNESDHFLVYERLKDKYVSIPEHPFINVKTFIEDAADKIGLGDPDKIHGAFLVCSDGVEKAFRLNNVNINDDFSHLVKDIFVNKRQNPAEEINKAAIQRGGGNDNCTAIATELDENLTKPVALFITDGYGQSGGEYARLAAKTFAASMEKALNPPAAGVNPGTSPSQSSAITTTPPPIS